MNPHNPSIFRRVVVCPNCHYATDAVNKFASQEVREVVSSSEYQELYMSAYQHEIMKSLRLAAYISEKVADSKDAARLYLTMHWYIQRQNTFAPEWLDKAIDNYQHYLSDVPDLDAALVLIDCLRQAGRFEEATESAMSLQTYIANVNQKKILDLELKLIQQRDSYAHLQSEGEQ